VNWTPTEHDIRVARLLDQELGPIRFIEVIHHEENRMTEQAPETESWDDAAPAAVIFPQQPENPHEAPLSVNFKPGGTPQLTVRGRTVAEHMDLLKQVQSSGLLDVVNSVSSAFGGQGGAQAMPQGGPFGQPTPPPFGPNVSVPAAPGYQGPPAQAAPWGGAPQQGGFGGGAPQGNRQGPKPRPAWPVVYKINVPCQGKDGFKAFREEHKDALKGKVAWAGGGDYWIHGDVVAGFGQYNPVAA